MKSPSGAWGGSPKRSPVLSKIAKRIKARIRERSVPDSAKAALSRREAKMGFGDEIPKRGLGRQSQRTPVLPQIAKRIKARIRERSVPDSTKAALNRREAKMGFGAAVPNVTPIPKEKRSFGAECKAFCNRNGSYPKPHLCTTPLTQKRPLPQVRRAAFCIYARCEIA